MPTSNNNDPITYFDLALLANNVYQDPSNRGINNWKVKGDPEKNFDSGLQLQNYQNISYPNHTVIAIAGTNSWNDWDDNIAFATGGLTQQVKDALAYVAKTIDTSVKNSEDSDSTGQIFSITGHSLGGGLAQIISHVFNIEGVSFKSPPAGNIVSGNEFKVLINKLKQDYPDAFNTPSTNSGMVNINEKGGPISDGFVSNIGSYLGKTTEINTVNDTQTVFGKIIAIVSPGMRLAMIADSLIDNHKMEAVSTYFKNNPDLCLTNKQLEQLRCEIRDIVHESKNNNLIDEFTFSTTDQALSNWQDTDIFNLNNLGQWEVNTPDTAFDDIGDLLDFEEAMFQELQDGWITLGEFHAAQDYVLNYSLGDDTTTNLNPNDYNNDPIGAFYDSQSAAYDTAQSIANSTGVLVGNNHTHTPITQAQLQALDTNNDGQLTNAETNTLRLWQDTNEDGHLNAGELVSLSTLNHPIQQSEYAFYTNGNAYIATTQPNQPNRTNEPTTPDSNYRHLRDTNNIYSYYLNGRVHYIVWDAIIKISEPYLIGTDGNDSFDVNYYQDYSFFDRNLLTHFLAGDGDDLMGGSNRNDNLWGGTGDDELYGYAGNDKIYGEQGNDKIFADVGDDTVLGGTGNDIIIGFTASNNDKQSLNAGETDNDHLYGGSGDDSLFGGLGDDHLDGGANNDDLLGEEGNDKLWGGNGNDELQGNQGNDELMGGSGDDRLFGQTGNDKLWGGAGNDLLLGFTASNEAKQSLNTGESDDDYLNGGSGNDVLIADLGNDRLYGSTGNDELQGNEGNDKLYGEQGNDNLFGQLGNDTLYGGDGDDYLAGFTASNEAKQSLNTGESDNDYLYGGAGQDTLIGGLGNDYLDGGADADVMVGGTDNDTYIVNSVNDSIYEQNNQGYDTVISSTSYLLNANIEELRLLEGFNIHGTGNGTNNKIIGNSGFNGIKATKNVIANTNIALVDNNEVVFIVNKPYNQNQYLKAA